MPTLAEVQMFNNAMDQLAQTLLRRRMLRDEREDNARRDVLARDLQSQSLTARDRETEAERGSRTSEAALDRALRERLATQAEQGATARLTSELAQRDKQQGSQAGLLAQREGFDQAATVAKMIQGGMVDLDKITPKVTEELNAKLKPMGIEVGAIKLNALKPEETGILTQESLSGSDEMGQGGIKTTIRRPLKPGETLPAPSGTNTTGETDPVAKKLTAIDKQIRENQAAMALGDQRTGPLNLRKRSDVVADLTKQRQALKAVPEIASLEDVRTRLAPSNDVPAKLVEKFDPAEILRQARAAIAKGAPRDQVIARLKAMGIEWTE